MHTSILTLGLALSASLSWAQGNQITEPTDFNATEALLDQGIDLSLLEQANLTTRDTSAHPTCPLMVQWLLSTMKHSDDSY